MGKMVVESPIATGLSKDFGQTAIIACFALSGNGGTPGKTSLAKASPESGARQLRAVGALLTPLLEPVTEARLFGGLPGLGMP